MNRRTPLLALLCLPLLACSPTENRERPDTGLRQTVDTCPRGDTPEAVVCNFFQYTLTFSGLPTNAQQSTVSSSLSGELRSALNQARAEPSLRTALQVRDSLFNSRFVRAEDFELGDVSAEAEDSVKIDIHFRQGEDRWHDTVELRRELRRLVLHDVHYRSADEGTPPSLLALLSTAAP